MAEGTLWTIMQSLPRTSAETLRGSRRGIPKLPGVYVWFLEGQPHYAGVARGKAGLHDRLGQHLRVHANLSRSSFRRNVCEELTGIPSSVTYAKSYRLTEEHLVVVNERVGRCEVTWRVLPSADAAEKFEDALLLEWMPPLNKAAGRQRD